MGACQSCLGIGRKDSYSSESDAGLLGGEHHQFHYGTFEGDVQPDPDAIRRERDALEQLCVNTNGQMVDVTEVPNMNPFDANHADAVAIVGPEVSTLLAESSHVSPPEVPGASEQGGGVKRVISTKHLRSRVVPVRGPIIKVF